MTAMRLHRYPSPSGGIALGKMGVGATLLKQGKTARDYVQNGLVAMWDGIENAGWGVSTMDGLVWKCLTDSKYDFYTDYSITSWVARDIRSTRVNDGFESLGNLVMGYGKNYLPAYDNFTIECVFNLPSISATTNLCVLRFNSEYRAVAAACVGPSSLFVTRPSYDSYSHSFSAGKYSVSFRSADVPFVNGIQVSGPPSGSGSNWPTNSSTYGTSSVVALGGVKFHSAASQGVAGIPKAGTVINNLRYYSRTLSADEIAANYAIDKERFNLP